MPRQRLRIRHRSPPPRLIPALPDPIRFSQSHYSKKKSKTHRNTSDQQNENNNNNHDKSKEPKISSANRLRSSEQQSSILAHNILTQNPLFTEESVVLSAMDDDIHLDKKHLPVFARFPFDFSLVKQTMETNVEDNVHKLRIRLIDSELNNQRRSTNEYIKRTQKETSLSSPTPSEYYIFNIRQPSPLVHYQILPKILRRQASKSILSIRSPTPIIDHYRDRVTIANNHSNKSDIDNDMDTHQSQVSLNKRRRSNHQTMVSNYSYDPRLHASNSNEQQIYASTNIDDIIDSMARRHLAARRLDAAIDRQRNNSELYHQIIEPVQFSNNKRTDDLLFTTRLARTPIERDFIRANPKMFNQRLRSRIEYYNRIQPDPDSIGNHNPVRRNSYTKLPPISPGTESTRHSHITHNPKSMSLNFTERTEHSIELASDIFITPRTGRTEITHGTNDENQISLINYKKANLPNENNNFFTESNVQQKKDVRRNLFQKTAIGILFFITLKYQSRKNRSTRMKRTPSAALQKIRLQEMIVALHRFYLEPDGLIYKTLIQTVNSSISFNDACNSSSTNHSEAIEILGKTVKNLISKITQFKADDDLFGTSRNSVVSVILQDGNKYPENYFWQCERELLEFNQSKIIHITKQRAILLLTGIFIFRALITTLLIKPVKYRLIYGQLKPNQATNLKVLASVLLYIGRRVAGPKFHMLPVPYEWQLSLFNDKQIETILQNSQIKSIIDSCEQSLRQWCEEYINQIDMNSGRELRT